MNIEVSFVTPLTVIHQQQPSEQWRAVFTIQSGNLTFKGENMSSTMQAGTYATVSVEWHDKGGNPVQCEKGSMKWDSSDPKICEIAIATGNEQIANLHAPGPIGKVTIHATGDADLGDGVRTVTATYDVEVIKGEAVSGEIKFSQDVSQGGTPPSGQSGPPKPGQGVPPQPPKPGGGLGGGLKK